MILGVVPARGGSKGIPLKALYPLCGKPLIEYTLEAAKNSKLDDIILTTDSHEIAEHWYPSKTIMRPPELAQDDTPMLPVIQHAVREYRRHRPSVTDIMILQPTSPLRTAEDINSAIAMYIQNHMRAPSNKGLVSVCEGSHPKKSYDVDGNPFDPSFYDKHKDKVYTRNGAIFITPLPLLERNLLWGRNPLLYLMPKTRSVDVDDLEDMQICEALLRSGVLEREHEGNTL